MIKIAVVDDDELICKDIVRLISKFNVCYDFDFRPEYYCSCEEVYNSIVSGYNYDLIFLDIEFSGMNGTEFGKMLRMKMKNYDTQIIFISSVRDYAMELFKIRPIEFLVKPITEETLRSCMLTYMTHFENSNGFLEYTLENIKHRIRIREVLYLESNRKKTEFHTRSSNFSVYGKITDIIGDNKNKFVRISRGVYVNIQHIIEVTTKEIHLTDNSTLYISRGCQDTVRDRLSEI